MGGAEVFGRSGSTFQKGQHLPRKRFAYGTEGGEGKEPLRRGKREGSVNRVLNPGKSLVKKLKAKGGLKIQSQR